MAQRKVYLWKGETKKVDFKWYAGFSKVQTQMNIVSLHEAYGDAKLVEVSSRSMTDFGMQLSPLHLRLGDYYVESLYQGSKVYASGQYDQLINENPFGVKKAMRALVPQGDRLLGFEYEGVNWPADGTSDFYDYLYLNALLRKSNYWRHQLNKYEGATDIMNTARMVACQARSCQIFMQLCEYKKFRKLKKLTPSAFRKWKTKYAKVPLI